MALTEEMGDPKRGKGKIPVTAAEVPVSLRINLVRWPCSGKPSPAPRIADRSCDGSSKRARPERQGKLRVEVRVRPAGSCSLWGTLHWRPARRRRLSLVSFPLELGAILGSALGISPAINTSEFPAWRWYFDLAKGQRGSSPVSLPRDTCAKTQRGS